jgi:hypothetical protein
LQFHFGLGFHFGFPLWVVACGCMRSRRFVLVRVMRVCLPHGYCLPT